MAAKMLARMSISTTSQSSFTTGADVLLVVSNLVFLVPVIKAARMVCAGDAIRIVWATVYVCIIVASGSYHLCNSFSSTCLFNAATHRAIDFFFAQLVIPLTALFLVYFSHRWQWLEWTAIAAFAALLFVLEITVGEGFIIQMILALACFLIVAGYWIGFALYRKRYGRARRARLPYYDWDAFLVGIVLTLLAVSLFATQMQWHSGYWAIHSLWHALGAMGQYFILWIKDGPQTAVVDEATDGAVVSRVWGGMTYVYDSIVAPSRWGQGRRRRRWRQEKITHIAPR